MSSDKISRRQFIQTSAWTAAALGTAASAGRVLGANERIRAAFIGVGNRGGQLLAAALPNKDLEIVALCDVFKPYLEKQAAIVGGEDLRLYADFRDVLDRADIDAVVIGTPDHWHAIQTIQACDAGKDVYVEKPLSIAVHEGRRMVAAARRNKRIVQVGTHRRSSTLYAELAEKVQAGMIGKVTVSRAYRLSNMFPDGIGNLPHSPAPDTLDWDMWLGPRPERPYQDNIAPYKFRWWHLYSSQVANWGVHYFDAIRWLLGENAPSSLVAMGGQFAVMDDRTIPDTMETIFEYPQGGLMLFGQYEASGNPAMRTGEVELRGTQGTLYVSERRFEVIPERGGQFQDSAPRMEAVTGESTDGDLTERHIRNFLDCIKSRSVPNADVEEGHRSTTFSLLANISLAVGRRLNWDAAAERCIGDEEANRLLQYEYRKPWKLG
jgi:predicted dehydrogenase